MRSQRTLQLRKESLAELTPDELLSLAAANRPTYGNICQGIYAYSDAIIFLITGTSGRQADE